MQVADDLYDLCDLEVRPPSLTDARGFDWDDIDTSIAPDLFMQLTAIEVDAPPMSDVRKQVNVQRRKCETERLRKHSWVRSPVKTTAGKRTKYVYTHADGTKATSLREALRQCRNVQS